MCIFRKRVRSNKIRDLFQRYFPWHLLPVEFYSFIKHRSKYTESRRNYSVKNVNPMKGQYSTSLIDGSNAENRILDGMYQLRYKVFSQRLNWDVSCENEREIDDYDDGDSLYLVTTDADDRVVGCWRLRKSTSRYMLKETFPDLLRGESVPVDDSVWELSRFAVDSSSDSASPGTAISSVTYQMVRAVYDFALMMGITHYVTVTTCSVQRLMTRAKIPMHRFGDGRATKIDNVHSVACWIPVNEEFRQSVSVPVANLKIETDRVTFPRKLRVS